MHQDDDMAREGGERGRVQDCCFRCALRRAVQVCSRSFFSLASTFLLFFILRWGIEPSHLIAFHVLEMYVSCNLFSTQFFTSSLGRRGVSVSTLVLLVRLDQCPLGRYVVWGTYLYQVAGCTRHIGPGAFPSAITCLSAFDRKRKYYSMIR